MRKNMPWVAPVLPPSRRASGSTRNCPQYQKPTNTVTSELQRNQFKAGKVRFSKIFGLDAASTVFMNGTFTRLKKYNSPTHRMPAIKWNQRRISMVASEPVTVGNTIAGITWEAASMTQSCMNLLRRYVIQGVLRQTPQNEWRPIITASCGCDASLRLGLRCCQHSRPQ